MKNLKTFLLGMFFCFGMLMLQSSINGGIYDHQQPMTQTVTIKYLYGENGAKYSLIITESTDHNKCVSVHTQLVTGTLHKK